MCVGCGDGTVRVFDRRLSPHESKIITFREHTSWVVNAALINEREIISGRYRFGDLPMHVLLTSLSILLISDIMITRKNYILIINMYLPLSLV